MARFQEKKTFTKQLLTTKVEKEDLEKSVNKSIIKYYQNENI